MKGIQAGGVVGKVAGGKCRIKRRIVSGRQQRQRVVQPTGLIACFCSSLFLSSCSYPFHIMHHAHAMSFSLVCEMREERWRDRR